MNNEHESASPPRWSTTRNAKEDEGSRSKHLALCTLHFALLLLAACGGAPEGDPVRFAIPEGSGLTVVSDTLTARGIIDRPFFFRIYARLRGADRSLKPGTYAIRRGTAWPVVLDKLVSGDVLTLDLVVPEGWRAAQITGGISQITGLARDSVAGVLTDTAAANRHGVPGPTLEGYLYPATYVFPVGSDLGDVVRTMTDRYRQAWTPEMRARADSLGMSEREVVTLASIIEEEARVWGERDTISAVYHNRLQIGMPLQADPTVQYALGEHQDRLLYDHIDEVADHPYNTYTHPGLPPGPIASPSQGAIEAALHPAGVDYLYFVAHPDGTHIFTHTLAEHNAAKRQAQRLRAAREAKR